MSFSKQKGEHLGTIGTQKIQYNNIVKTFLTVSSFRASKLQDVDEGSQLYTFISQEKRSPTYVNHNLTPSYTITLCLKGEHVGTIGTQKIQ